MTIFLQILMLLSLTTYFVNGQGRVPSSKGPYKRGHCVQDIETSLNCECPKGTRAYCRNNKFEVPKAQRTGGVDKLKPAADAPEAIAKEVVPALPALLAEERRRRKRSVAHTTTVCKAPGELDLNMDPKSDVKIQCVKSFRTYERNRWSIPRKSQYTYPAGAKTVTNARSSALEPAAPAPVNDEPAKNEPAPAKDEPAPAPATGE